MREILLYSFIVPFALGRIQTCARGSLPSTATSASLPLVTTMAIVSIVVAAAGRGWSKSIKIMRGSDELSISRAIEHFLPHCILGEKVAIANNPQGLSCPSQCNIDTSKVLKESKGAKFTSPIGVKRSDA